MKVMKTKKSRLILFAIIVLALISIPVASRAIQWLSNYNRPQITGTYYQQIRTTQKIVALTYDDGPNPPFTDSILAVLKRRGVHATFFAVGEHVALYPAVTQTLIAGGHELGNHTWSHVVMLWKTPGFMRSQIEKTDSIIRSSGYTGEIYFRAPFGRKLIVLPLILNSLHKTHISFDVVPVDWENNSVPMMLGRVTTAVRPGSIILLHDGGGARDSTVRLTEQIIDTLEKKGYAFKTISEMIRNNGE